ncbi:MAG TPA: DUF72 domain-containing protein [Pyrinomonadaceae bacterium]|nr:DUF72 domain-containing protein [Pyrinomonadaceae bacterium]
MTARRSQARVHVGCQGWNYDDWLTGPVGSESVFYPRGTRAPDMLSLYARVFDTVEVDSTFYAIPSIQTVDGWNKRTPRHFTFSLKMPQEITHEYALRRGSLEALSEFCDRIQLLDEKLAVVLIQMAPQFDATADNENALREFLPALPRDVRFSIEFRSRDWIRPATLELLNKYQVALALVEGRWIPRDFLWRLMEQPTAPFAYIRWMGERDLVRFDTVQRPQNVNLHGWHELIESLAERVSDIYAYFSNYYEGHAPAGANKLKRMLGQPIVDPSDLEDQPSLF